MSREIKFRAWDTKNKQMVNLGDLLDVVLANGTHQFVFGEAEFMQFTGLKDKNGKEIYEGDVVHNLPSKKSVLAPNGWTGEIVRRNYKRSDNFYDCAFFLKCGKDIYLHVSKDCEIIGNICENPELLAPLTK